MSVIVKSINKLLYFRGIWLCLTAVLLVNMAFAQGQSQNVENKQIKFLIRIFNEDGKLSKDTFRVGEKIIVRAMIKNNSNEPFSITYLSDYYQFRFDLRQLGSRKSERFRKDKAEIIANSSQNSGVGGRLSASPIRKGEFREIKTFNIENWYENLGPGKYKLVISYRPDISSLVMFSNPVIIEIVP